MSNRKIPKQATSKVGQYSLQTKFPGYNARKDPTTLDPATLIAPSQNMVVGTSGRIGTVRGFTLDGDSSDVIDSGILSNFDFLTSMGATRNLRCGFLTVAGNDGKMQFRYKESSGTIKWVDLWTNRRSVTVSFCEYWDTTELVKKVLWVDGTEYVFSWSGATTTLLSATATTVKLVGGGTWQQAGFTSTGSIIINGITGTYTGGYTTDTLTGVSVDFSGQAPGELIVQGVQERKLASMTAILANFNPTVIGCGRLNQVYLGSEISNNVYISAVNNFADYSFHTPRVAGEGALIQIDAPPRKFIAQEVTAADGGDTAYDMWISEGLHTWGIIRSSLSANLANETLQHIRLKVGPRQAAISERMVTKVKNHIAYVSNDKVCGFIGYNSYQYVPAITDFSYPIINDQNSYDLTHGSTFYNNNYFYEAVPRHGLIRVYNMTDQTAEQDSQYKAIEDVTGQPWFWESPITYPIAGFYVTEDGEIGGHGYTTSESYLLFSGGSFNGKDIDYNATFAFDDGGDRSQSKGSDEIWVDGYINQTTEIKADIGGDLGTFRTDQQVTIQGSDPTIVSFGAGGGSLGSLPLGSASLGGAGTATVDVLSLPPYFHVAKTFQQQSYYLEQISFSCKGIDKQFEIISFGTNKRFTNEGNNSITQ